MNRRLALTAFTALSVCFTLTPMAAHAATFTLVGSSFRSCVEDTEGFTAAPDFQPNPLPGGNPTGTHFLRVTNHANSTTLVIDTNGTVTVTDQVTTNIRNTTPPRILVVTSTCNGTWNFDVGAQEFSTATTCSFSDIVPGPSTGTIGNLHATYRIAGTSLVRVEPTTPVVETVNVATGTGAPFSYQRICGTSATLTLQ